MDWNIRNLFAAVAIAAGHNLEADSFDDRLTLQRGCYLLNSQGYGPRFRFDMFVHGPYSSSLTDEFLRIGDIYFRDTNISLVEIDNLKDILSKGLHYAEAYTTLMMVRDNSPNAPYSGIIDRAIELKPDLKNEIMEASGSLLE